MRALLALSTLPLLLVVAGCPSSSQPSPEPDAGEPSARAEAPASDAGAGEGAWWGENAGSGEVASPHGSTAASPHGMPHGMPPGMAAHAGGEAPDSDEGPEVRTASGLTLTAPESWNRKQPRRSAMVQIDAEFAVPAVEGDDEDGRVTMMAAGGSVDDNLQRWFGMFKQPDGSKTEDAANVEEKTIAGKTVHLVDVAGKYKAPPFEGGGEKPDYRMLAAIVEMGATNYFVKFYGPAKTVAENEDGFRAMIEGME
jgi:hypothetical protein